MEHNYYLAHHGVKGQKWGVRNVRKVRNGKPVSERTLRKGGIGHSNSSF